MFILCDRQTNQSLVHNRPRFLIDVAYWLRGSAVYKEFRFLFLIESLVLLYALRVVTVLLTVLATDSVLLLYFIFVGIFKNLN